MVTDELADGKRIGQLLSSEIHGHERGVLGQLEVVDADPDVEVTADGVFAYAIATDHGNRIADVYVYPDRIRVEILLAPEVAGNRARGEGFQPRQNASDPARTIVFVENGAAVKPALRVVRTVAAEVFEEAG